MITARSALVASGSRSKSASTSSIDSDTETTCEPLLMASSASSACPPLGWVSTVMSLSGNGPGAITSTSTSSSCRTNPCNRWGRRAPKIRRSTSPDAASCRATLLPTTPQPITATVATSAEIRSAELPPLTLPGRDTT